MKKIILCIVCLLCLHTPIYAAETVSVEKVPTGLYSMKTSAAGKTFKAPLYKLFVQDRVAYCIEPGVTLQDQDYTVGTDFSQMGISDETRKEMELIAHYGYQYPGHETTEYYMATQELIWEKMGATHITYLDAGDNPLNVDSFKHDILRFIEHHNELPSFAFTEHTIPLNEELELTDTHHVLYKYQLKDGQGKIEGDSFKVIHPEEKSKEYLFESKKQYDVSLAYYANHSQKVATFTLSDDTISAFSVKVISQREKGNLHLKKIDALDEKALTGAEFSLYDIENHFIMKGKTGLDGTLLWENIPYGKYYLKETKAPKGYLKQEDFIFVTVDKEQNTVEVRNQKYEMPITSNIDIKYHKASIGLLLVGIGCFYVSKKAY